MQNPFKQGDNLHFSRVNIREVRTALERDGSEGSTMEFREFQGLAVNQVCSCTFELAIVCALTRACFDPPA